ncbi:MAG: hypothetical protein A2857_05535 [Candidatus Levybacteria bacterium RIFCSPHIGHO2_01_FULL_36_15]|nr:MAG: hypothetical protein A2857_05535 [Candidatus Levybacteria bacterium RIFCSPHIGHO2_01_FULL_36_15]
MERRRELTRRDKRIITEWAQRFGFSKNDWVVQDMEQRAKALRQTGMRLCLIGKVREVYEQIPHRRTREEES